MLVFKELLETDSKALTTAGSNDGHAFSVLKTCTFKKNDEDIHLVKLRDPWGNINGIDWQRQYEDESDNWTAMAKKECDFQDGQKNEGVFFLTAYEYYMNFAHTAINHNISGWKQGYYLKLDDYHHDFNLGSPFEIKDPSIC